MDLQNNVNKLNKVKTVKIVNCKKCNILYESYSKLSENHKKLEEKFESLLQEKEKLVKTSEEENFKTETIPLDRNNNKSNKFFDYQSLNQYNVKTEDVINLLSNNNSCNIN